MSPYPITYNTDYNSIYDATFGTNVFINNTEHIVTLTKEKFARESPILDEIDYALNEEYYDDPIMQKLNNLFTWRYHLC